MNSNQKRKRLTRRRKSRLKTIIIDDKKFKRSIRKFYSIMIPIVRKHVYTNVITDFNMLTYKTMVTLHNVFRDKTFLIEYNRLEEKLITQFDKFNKLKKGYCYKIDQSEILIKSFKDIFNNHFTYLYNKKLIKTKFIKQKLNNSLIPDVTNMVMEYIN